MRDVVARLARFGTSPRWLLGALTALLVTTGCTRPPAARLEVTPLPGAPDLRLWCRHRGLHPPVTVLWRLGGAMRQLGAGPRDMEFLDVVGPGPSPRAGLWEVRCEATDVDGVKVEAATSLLPPRLQELTLDGTPVLAATPRAASGTLMLRGAELGTKRGPEDGVWLAPSRGAPISLPAPGDPSCPTATWSANQITTCLLPVAARSYEVRVQTGGRLVHFAERLVIAERGASPGSGQP